MRHRPLIAMTAAAVLATTLAAPGIAGPFRERLRERMAQRMMERAAAMPQGPAIPATESLTYGKDAQQRLDFWKAPAAHAPLVVFVHGGGWKRGSKDNATGSWKADHFTKTGYAFASIDYRLVPEASVEQQAADVAAAVRKLIDEAGRLGVDRRRVVIMGHSAGAHLVALVGTDERYLKGAGLSFADLAGVIPIDGAAYDVAAQIKDAGRFMKPTYQQAFGSDPARQKALSPTLQAAAPNAPAFLLIHVQRADGIAQNKALEAALKVAGTRVERRDFPGDRLQGHMEINRRLGDPDYAATPVVDAWLKAQFAQ